VAELDLRRRLAARPDAYVPGVTVDALGAALRDTMRSLARRGVVVGVSGGVDSAACAALAARVLPGTRLRLVHLPDRDTDAESGALAADVASALDVPLAVHDITAAIAGLGAYEELAAKVAALVDRPAGTVASWKLVRTEPSASLPVRWRIAGVTSEGSTVDSGPLHPRDLAYVVARQGYKQQVRASVLYRIAEEEHFLVVGTANRVEIRAGFFVRHGDGSGDDFPLRHLFKSEVRRLATELGVDERIAGRTATTDTYSAAQTQREFFFGIDEEPFDLVLFGFEQSVPVQDVAAAAAIPVATVEGIYADLVRRQPFLRYLLHDALNQP
jgi:NAD+ synthase